MKEISAKEEETGEGKKINRRRYTRQPINRAPGPRGYQDCYVSHSCGKLDRWKYFKARQIRVANGHVRGRARPPNNPEKISREMPFPWCSSSFLNPPSLAFVHRFLLLVITSRLFLLFHLFVLFFSFYFRQHHEQVRIFIASSR